MIDYTGTLIMLAFGIPLIIVVWVGTALLVKVGIDIWRDK